MEVSMLFGGKSIRVAGGNLPKSVACLGDVAFDRSLATSGSNKSAQSDALSRAAGLRR
jgi:hypothetical protein